MVSAIGASTDSGVGRHSDRTLAEILMPPFGLWGGSPQRPHHGIRITTRLTPPPPFLQTLLFDRNLKKYKKSKFYKKIFGKTMENQTN